MNDTRNLIPVVKEDMIQIFKTAETGNVSWELHVLGHKINTITKEDITKKNSDEIEKGVIKSFMEKFASDLYNGKII